MSIIELDAGRIVYTDRGDGPPILLVHGAFSNANTWRKVIEPLSASYRCIAPNLPLGGHTLPLHANADLTPPGIAALLAQFVDALGLDEVIVVGNDTGGAYAQIFTAAYPEKVSRLVLSNADSFEVFPPKPFAPLKSAVRVPGFTFVLALLLRFKPLLTSSLVLGLLSHKLSNDEARELYVNGYIENSGVRADFAKMVKGWSTTYTLEAANKLKAFDKPVLLIWGADDRKLFPLELGRRLYAIFSNVRFEAVDGSLTYVQEDRPDNFVEIFTDFMKQS